MDTICERLSKNEPREIYIAPNQHEKTLFAVGSPIVIKFREIAIPSDLQILYSHTFPNPIPTSTKKRACLDGGVHEQEISQLSTVPCFS